MRRIPAFALLRAFQAAARESSFARAASQLHLTPSAVSHQIKELEASLGRALFGRQHRRIELTPAGRLLATRLDGLFESIAAACEEVANLDEDPVLRLHAAPSFATKWLAPRLRDFAQAHPDYSLELTSSAEPVDLIEQRGSDVAISYGRAVRRDGLWVRALGDEEIAPMCSPSLLERGGDARALLHEVPLIWSPLNHVTWETWFAAQGLSLPGGRRLSLDRAALGISAAADGLGIVLESVRLAEQELRGGTLVRLDVAGSPAVRRETHFVSVRHGDLPKSKVQAFLRWLLPLVGVDATAAAVPANADG